MKTTNPRATFLVAMLMTTSALAILALPPAAAHVCQAENPASQCGPCPNGNHDHEYNDGRQYCYSQDPRITCALVPQTCISYNLPEEVEDLLP